MLHKASWSSPSLTEQSVSKASRFLRHHKRSHRGLNRAAGQRPLYSDLYRWLFSITCVCVDARSHPRFSPVPCEFKYLSVLFSRLL